MSAVPSTQSAAAQDAGAFVTELRVTGMTCNNCARYVTEAIQGVAGVRSASVALAAGRATARWPAGHTANPAALVAAIEQSGYGAKTVAAGGPDQGDQDQSGWHASLWVGLESPFR